MQCNTPFILKQQILLKPYIDEKSRLPLTKQKGSGSPKTKTKLKPGMT